MVEFCKIYFLIYFKCIVIIFNSFKLYLKLISIIIEKNCTDFIFFFSIKIIIELQSLMHREDWNFNVLPYFVILFIFFLIGNFNRGYFIEKLERMDWDGVWDELLRIIGNKLCRNFDGFYLHVHFSKLILIAMLD